MIIKNFRFIKHLAPFGVLFVVDISEVLALILTATIRPDYLVPIFVITQSLMICVNSYAAFYIWKKTAKRYLGLLQKRIATLSKGGRSPTLTECAN